LESPTNTPVPPTATPGIGIAAVVDTTGNVVQVSPPVSVALNAYQSDTEIRVFDERTVTLTGPLAVDSSQQGSFTSAAQLTAGSVVAGLTVESHLVHFDTVVVSGVTLAGTVRFSETIVGLLVFDNSLDGSDAGLGAVGATYPTAGQVNRGLELDGSGGDRLIVSCDTLDLQLTSFEIFDHIRVITANVPCTPATATPTTGSSTPTSTPAPPTNTPFPPTDTPTPAPPTNTPIPPTDTPTPLPPTATFTPTPTPDLIFADSFEAGNLAAWTASVIDGGDLSAAPAAALIGSTGLQVVVNNNTAIYITDDLPQIETRYRARFYFDPNGITMADNNAHYIFYGYTGSSTVVLRVEFRRSNGAYQVRASTQNDVNVWLNTNWFTISDAPHFIEFDWRAATAVGANNGNLTLWLDGVQQASLNAIDNDSRRIDRIRLGPVGGLDSGTRGAYFMDAFESRRATYIGPVVSTPPSPTPTNTSIPTNTPTPIPGATNTPLPTPTNTPVPTATPTPGPNFALAFDGVDDWMRTGQVTGVGPLTMEAWVRPAQNGANGIFLAQSSGNNGWSLELNNGNFTLWLFTSQGWQFIQHPLALQAGQWYHLAATYNNDVAQTFVNGIGSTAANVGTLTQGSTMYFGGYPALAHYNGQMDQARISNVVRYATNFTPSVQYTLDANTLGLWLFNEGSGQLAIDTSSLANHATLGNNGNADRADPTWVPGF
jgi:hypothetical protein